MTFNPHDYYFKKAKKEGFKARSVFKLDQIQQKFKIFNAQSKVLDLGCSPGSWSQWVSQKLGGDQGIVVGVDLKSVNLRLSNAIFIEGDISQMDLSKELLKRGIQLDRFDLIISDMAPKTTGIKVTDQARSFDLCNLALDIAGRWLKLGGNIVIKLFHSEDFKILKHRIESEYKRFEVFKPHATRSESKEIFLIGLVKK